MQPAYDPPLSAAQVVAAEAPFLRSLCAAASRALSRWLRKTGMAMAARMPMMITTIFLQSYKRSWVSPQRLARGR